MKLREKFKRFWTMDVHNHEGFTLVELIIVIAILAILSGVAVAGYSSYITKANMQADRTLIAEIENALMLAYYSGELTESGYILLTTTDGPDYNNHEEIGKALDAAYGSGINSLKLKYTGWVSDYAGTSFEGNESMLLGKIDGLTEKLNDVIDAAGGDNFKKFLELNGLTSDEAGGAAVLYVAQITGELDSTKKAEFVNIIQTIEDPTQLPLALMSVLGGVGTGGDVASAAATYALIEAYCVKKGYDDIVLNSDNIEDVNTAGAAIVEMYNKIKEKEGGDAGIKEYLKGDGAKDALAYLEVMSTVNTSKNTIIDNGLGDFSSLLPLFEAYSSGGVLINVIITNDEIEITNTLQED